MSTRAERHLQALRLAQDCWSLGARVRTMHILTGLPQRELQRLFFTDASRTPRGRAPDSPDWYHGANLLYRAEASICISVYRRLRDGGFAGGEALVGAYRHYQSVCQCPYRISFDRAFDLAAHTDGIWVTSTISFDVIACPCCDASFLAPAGAIPSARECPFCRLVERYPYDHRIQNSFPMRHACSPSARPAAEMSNAAHRNAMGASDPETAAQ